MMAGSRRPDGEQAVDQAEHGAEQRRRPAAASQGSRPATISSADDTAEKLNIQPTERSISRIASRNTMPTASMPRKVVLPSIENRLIGLRKRGRAMPMTATITSSATMTPISSGRRKRGERRRRRVGGRISVMDGIGRLAASSGASRRC